MVTGGLKTALPVVRTFDAKSLENNQASTPCPTKKARARWSAAAQHCWIKKW